MNTKIVIVFTLILIGSSCSSDSNKEKHQNNRNKIVNVKDKVHEIKIENVLIGSIARLYLLKNVLIIADPKSFTNLIHIFDKNNFKYITSCAPIGQGPSEITNMGHIGIDNDHRKFYVSDHGKQKIFSYDLDSVILNPGYIPKVKARMNNKQFPSTYYFINDTLSISRIIMPTGNYGFNEIIAKWNMVTGEIKPMKYKHPEIEKRRVTFAISNVNNCYVECYAYHDLMTICDFSGKLLYNIYGPNWDSKKSNRILYYDNVTFCGDKIFATYSGNETNSKDYFPTKFIVFDKTGDYIQTLETGYKICDFCYDEEHDRIIMNLDDVIQFGYLDLKELNK